MAENLLKGHNICDDTGFVRVVDHTANVGEKARQKAVVGENRGTISPLTNFLHGWRYDGEDFCHSQRGLSWIGEVIKRKQKGSKRFCSDG